MGVHKSSRNWLTLFVHVCRFTSQWNPYTYSQTYPALQAQAKAIMDSGLGLPDALNFGQLSGMTYFQARLPAHRYPG